MKKEKVVIGLPISFMKKGDFGYVSYQYTPLVYDDDVFNGSLESLKVYRLLSKEASFFKFSLDRYVRVTKVSDSGTSLDFNLIYPLDFALVPIPKSSIDLSKYFDELVEVDYEILTEMSAIAQDIDLSNYTYLELCELMSDYTESVSFSKLKESAEKILDFLPSAMKKYLDSFDRNYLLIFQQEILKSREEEFDSIPDSEVKTFVGDFYDLAILTLKDYIDESNGTLPSMVTDLEKLSKSELQKLMDQALEVKDWKLVEKIDNLLKG